MILTAIAGGAVALAGVLASKHFLPSFVPSNIARVEQSTAKIDATIAKHTAKISSAIDDELNSIHQVANHAAARVSVFLASPFVARHVDTELVKDLTSASTALDTAVGHITGEIASVSDGIKQATA